MGSSVWLRHKAGTVQAQGPDGPRDAGMREIAMVFAMICPVMGVAEGWAPLDGPTIAKVLTNAELQFAAARQTFDADGSTLYDAGRPSFGRWQVQGDQYCSQWPPSDRWACYEMTQNGNALRFIADDGSVSEGLIVE